MRVALWWRPSDVDNAGRNHSTAQLGDQARRMTCLMRQQHATPGLLQQLQRGTRLGAVDIGTRPNGSEDIRTAASTARTGRITSLTWKDTFGLTQERNPMRVTSASQHFQIPVPTVVICEDTSMNQTLRLGHLRAARISHQAFKTGFAR